MTDTKSLRALISLLAGVLICGCTTTSSTNTARTAKEQLLISNAIDQSLSAVDFRPFGGQKVFLDEKYLDCVDKSYVVGSVRHRMLREGAELVSKADDADILVEVRSGAVGTDTAESFLGVPEVVLPGVVTLPEIRVVSRYAQNGTAKIGLVAYDAKTKQALGDGGVSLARSDDNNWYVMGVGPFQTGSVRSEVGDSQYYRPAHQYAELPTKVAFAAPDNRSGAEAPHRLTSVDEESPFSATPPRTAFEETAVPQGRQ